MMKSIMESVAICCVGLFCVVFCSINRWLEMLWVFLFCKQKKASLLGPRAWDHAFSKGLFTNLSDLTLSVMVDKIRHLVGWLYTPMNVGHHPGEFPLGRLFLVDLWERWYNGQGRVDISTIINTVESFKHPITYLVVPRWAGWKLSYLHFIYIYIYIYYDVLICSVVLVGHAEVICLKLFLFVKRERSDFEGLLGLNPNVFTVYLNWFLNFFCKGRLHSLVSMLHVGLVNALSLPGYASVGKKPPLRMPILDSNKGGHPMALTNSGIFSLVPQCQDPKDKVTYQHKKMPCLGVGILRVYDISSQHVKPRIWVVSKPTMIWIVWLAYMFFKN